MNLQTTLTAPKRNLTYVGLLLCVVALVAYVAHGPGRTPSGSPLVKHAQLKQSASKEGGNWCVERLKEPTKHCLTSFPIAELGKLFTVDDVTGQPRMEKLSVKSAEEKLKGLDCTRPHKISAAREDKDSILVVYEGDKMVMSVDADSCDVKDVYGATKKGEYHPGARDLMKNRKDLSGDIISFAGKQHEGGHCFIGDHCHGFDWGKAGSMQCCYNGAPTGTCERLYWYGPVAEREKMCGPIAINSLLSTYAQKRMDFSSWATGTKMIVFNNHNTAHYKKWNLFYGRMFARYVHIQPNFAQKDALALQLKADGSLEFAAFDFKNDCQQFMLQHVSGGKWTIKAKCNGRCLAVLGTSDLSPVVGVTCDSSHPATQTWRLV